MSQRQSNSDSSVSKVMQVAEYLQKKIGGGAFKAGDPVPSINTLSRELNVSRDTVFKAYALLKRRKILASAPTRGYFVHNIPDKVFLLLDSYSPYKDVLYHSFVNNLPENLGVDLAFHHYNPDIFRTLLLNAVGKYSAYVIMNTDNGKIADELRRIDPQKLLLLDWGQFSAEKYNYIGQDFGEAALACFRKALPLLKKYRSATVYFPDDSEHPAETVDVFSSFCRQNNIPCTIINKADPKQISKGKVCLLFRPAEVVEVLKIMREKEYQAGKEVGLLVYNDMPLYEVIGDGITVLSTDFSRMGLEAARFVSSGKKVRKYIPTRLIKRGSL